MTAIFQHLSQVSVAALRGAGGYWQRQAGQHLFREGDPAESLYIVLKGSVEIYRDGDDGEVWLGTCGPGEVIGEMGLLGNQGRRSASARATELTTVYEIESKLEALLERIPNWDDRFQFIHNLMALLHTRLSTADGSDAPTIRAVPVVREEVTRDLPLGLDAIERNLPSALLELRSPPKKLYPGGWLCQAGDPSDGFWVIHQGSLNAINESGRSLGPLFAPTLVGAEGFFASKPRSASVVATSQVEHTYFSGPDYQKLKESNPQEALEIFFGAAQLTVALVLQRKNEG